MPLSHDPIGLAILNSKGIIQSVNPYIEIMTGYNDKAVVGKNIAFLIPDFDFLSKDNNSRIEKITHKDSGEVINVNVSISHHNVGNRKLITLVIAQESKQSNGKDLEEIKKEAKQAAEKKNEFLARMSHEIRTPMNGIIGTISLLEGTELSEKQNNYVHTIKSSGKSLLVILNEILDFSALEAGKIEAVNEPLDLYNCIDEIYHLFQAPIQEKGLKFNLEYDDIPEYIMGDHGRIRQVVINLINNALKFTTVGSITLKILVQNNYSNSSDYLKFLIYDTGDGIAEDKLKELFQAFSQVDESSVRKAGGTGLGLSICKSIAEIMGGEIGVESEVGKGSVFWFSIPLNISSDEDLQIICNKQAEYKEELTKLKYNASILLVDDVEVNRFVVTEILEGYGCPTNQAENGEIATDMAKNGSYDLIFMDCQMPVMDGFQAAKEIRKFDKNIPIIALTANVLAAEKDKCFSSGMNDFIAKPITKECFAPIFNKWIPSLVIEADEINNQVEVKTSAVAENNNAPLDVAFLEQFGDHVEKVIELTIKDADDLVFNIDKAIKDRNALDAGLEAHSFKSVMAQIGAKKIAKIAKNIEHQGKSGEFDGIEIFYRDLKLEYKIVTDFLHGYIRPRN